MSERLVLVELVRHRDVSTTSIMVDSAGGLSIFASGTGMRLVLPPDEARKLARRLENVADSHA
jgi:hypothetical protein